LCFYLTGCKEPEQKEPLRENVKIGDLAPAHSGQSAPGGLKTINFNIHVFEIPAENINRLSDFWQTLRTQPLRFNSFKAFRDNSFLIGFGQMKVWGRINDELIAAGGQKITTISLMLEDNQPDDLTITELSTPRNISFIASDGSDQRANIGPGNLVLRIKAEKIPESRDGCKLTVYPVFTVPLGSPIEELNARLKAREFAFSSAAFSLNMGIGDFVVLGPERYLNVPSTLDGLLFSKPEGSLFPAISEGGAHQIKPAVRILIFFYSRINY
jgi:hypothetical protein